MSKRNIACILTNVMEILDSEDELEHYILHEMISKKIRKKRICVEDYVSKVALKYSLNGKFCLLYTL